MSRDWCERCYGKDHDRFELDENGRCPRCDKGEIENEDLRQQVAALTLRVEKLERKAKNDKPRR